MKRIPYKAYGLIIITLFILLSLPLPTSQRLRGQLVQVTIPISSKLQAVGTFLGAPMAMWRNWGRCEDLEQRVAALELENARLFEEWFKLDALTEAIPPVESLLASVVYRAPTSWNSSLWINVGSGNSASIVRKNSPVVIGDALVGVIDYVGVNQSRVRLITDSGLTTSVRALRGDAMLAKGELHGSSEPLWRAPSSTLTGIGFNYDFADGEGPARDLRTGEPVGSDNSLSATPILQIGDTLITTGMDGVFPTGLRVATISQIELLREGAYSYTIEAKPVAENLFDLSHLFVIAPMGYNPEDTPPLIGEVLPELPVN